MRLVPLESLSSPDIQEWRNLADGAAEANVFFEPDFVTAAAGSPNVKAPRLLIAERQGRWIGCLPVEAAGPFAMASWRHAYSYIGMPLVEAGRLEEFAATLVGHLRASRRNRFLLLSEAIDAEVTAAIRDAVARTADVTVNFEHGSERAALRRRPEGEPDAVRPKRRKEAEKNRRRLGEELSGEPRVVACAAGPDTVDAFLRLEAKGWKGAQGTAMLAAGDGDMFREVCRRYAAADRLQILALEAGGRPLAMQCNLSAGDALFNLKVAFDEEFRRFAPGIQLELEAMRIFQADRHEEIFDSCAAPDNELLNRLWPDRVRTTTMLIGRDGALDRAAGRAIGRRRRRRAAAAAT